MNLFSPVHGSLLLMTCEDLGLEMNFVGGERPGTWILSEQVCLCKWRLEEIETFSSCSPGFLAEIF